MLVGLILYSLFVYVNELHVHGVDGGEDVGGTLDDALPGLGHGDGRAGREEHWLVATTQWQERQVVSLD